MFDKLINIPNECISVSEMFQHLKDASLSNSPNYQLNDIDFYEGISSVNTYAVLGEIENSQILLLQIQLNNDALFSNDNTDKLWEFINSVYRTIKTQIILFFDYDGDNKFKICIPPLTIGKRDPDINISTYTYISCWIHSDCQSFEVSNAIHKINKAIVESDEIERYQKIEEAVKDITFYPINKKMADDYFKELKISPEACKQISNSLNYLERHYFKNVYRSVDREDLYVALMNNNECKDYFEKKNINSLESIKPFIDIVKSSLNSNSIEMKTIKTFMIVDGKKLPFITSIDSENTPAIKIFVNYYEAIQLCNIRSEKSGLTPYYSIDKNNLSISTNLHSTGYRLPNEIEMRDYCTQILDRGTDNTSPIWSDEWDQSQKGKNTYSFTKSLSNKERLLIRSHSPFSNCARVRMIKNVPIDDVDTKKIDKIYTIDELQKRINKLSDLHLQNSNFIKKESLQIEQDCCCNIKITWRDATLICNLRSERNNMTPFYNPKFNYRNNSFMFKQDFSANGYRLPTKQELDSLLTLNVNIINEIWCIDQRKAKVWSNGKVHSGKEAFVRMVLNSCN